MSTILDQTLDCGARFVAEPAAAARSVALTWLLPVGSAAEADDEQGRGTMLSELIFRGAGGRSSRELSEAFDRLGADRSAHIAPFHLELRITALADLLPDILPLVVDVVRRPALPDDAVESVRRLCLQTLDGLRDDPQQYVLLRLGERHLPAPFNRHGYGERAALETITGLDLRAAWTKRAVPDGSIITVAGGINPSAVMDQLNELLAGWSGETREPDPDTPPARGVLHEQDETAQVHLGLAYDAPPEGHEHSMLERLATTVLSGGMSGRLFTEVRERRALVYSVGATYHAGRDRGHVRLYAGTTPERAQETLDVSINEIERLRQGVTPEEFRRAVTGAKSRLVMQGESTSARAGSLAADVFRLGHPRSLGEIAAAVDAVTLDDLNDYLAQRDFGDYTIVSLGPKALSRPAPVGTEQAAP